VRDVYFDVATAVTPETAETLPETEMRTVAGDVTRFAR